MNTSAPVTPAWLSPFQRVTSGGAHIREIDGLRFIAISAVLLLHLNHYVVLNSAAAFVTGVEESVLYKLLDKGAFGVQIFFAISGFILSLPFLRYYTVGGKKVQLKHYFLRRLTRLEPPLIINLLILLGLMVFALNRPLGVLFPHFLATCTYLHTAIFGDASIISPVTWSLEVEAQFYILMPVLAQLFRIRSFFWRQVLMVTLIVGFGLLRLPVDHAVLTEQIEYFIVGFIMADWWLLWKEKPVKKAVYDGVAVLAWLTLVVALYWHRSIPGYGALLPFLVVIAGLSSLRGPRASRLLSGVIPVTLGGMCYTLYLYHLAIMSAMSDVITPRLHFDSYGISYLVTAVLILPVVIVLGMVFFALFERPFMSWNPWRAKKRE